MARTQGHGNPKWSRDETILALDLYFLCDEKIPSANDARVLALSHKLRGLPHHALSARKPSFRNAEGVVFKLQNLRAVATGQGLKNVSDMDRRVWEEFRSSKKRLKEIAALLEVSAAMLNSFENAVVPEDREEFVEGRMVTSLHKTVEREPKVRMALLVQRRRIGPLRCDLCRKTALASDTLLEDAIFEAHHTVPMHLAVQQKTRLSDMDLLCANCHKLLHRLIAASRQWLSVDQARERLGFDIDSKSFADNWRTRDVPRH